MSNRKSHQIFRGNDETKFAHEQRNEPGLLDPISHIVSHGKLYVCQSMLSANGLIGRIHTPNEFFDAIVITKSAQKQTCSSQLHNVAKVNVRSNAWVDVELLTVIPMVERLTVINLIPPNPMVVIASQGRLRSNRRPRTTGNIGIQ